MATNFFGDHELLSTDPDRARAFYGALFGWQMHVEQIPGFGSRTEMTTPTGTNGSIMPQRPGQGSAWSVYVNVADLRATVAQVEALGGKVLVPPQLVEGEGLFACVADPTGASFKLWQSLKG